MEVGAARPRHDISSIRVILLLFFDVLEDVEDIAATRLTVEFVSHLDARVVAIHEKSQSINAPDLRILLSLLRHFFDDFFQR